MGRKSSSKGQRQPGDAASETGEKKGRGSLFLIITMVVAVGAGAYLIWGQGPTAAETEAAAQKVQSAAEDQPDAATMAKIEANAKATAALGPHKQASYPPVPFQDFAPPRPIPTVNAAFQFAAEHPEVLSYIPCFCGCQHMGHKGNEDCFVKARNAAGDVTEWEPHGVECAVCIDVATRARQMTASGASVEQIRTAVEKEFKTTMASETPTPHSPH